MKLPSALRIKYDEFLEEGSLMVFEGTVLDIENEVYSDLERYIEDCRYDVMCLGFDPYNAKEFVNRWSTENGPYNVEKVIQGMKTESVPLGELKKLAEDRALLFDQALMSWTMGNSIVLKDNNNNKKLYKKRQEMKIDSVAAMMDAWVAYKLHKDDFE
jgi:phage terminase large subunit-like protein